MKKLFFAAMMLLSSVTINSMNTITMGDTVRINPNKLDGYFLWTAKMVNEGMCDQFSISVTYPRGLSPKLVSGIVPFDEMAVLYMDKNGEESYYMPSLTVSAAYADISCHIPILGYWDYNMDGELESYGTAKWMPGTHDMFGLNLAVQPYFRSGTVIFDGTITSGSDQRGAVLQGVRFYSRTYFYVGLAKGDVTGNEQITIGDLTDLIDFLLGTIMFDEFQKQAADTNRDGEINIADVTTLVDMLQHV